MADEAQGAILAELCEEAERDFARVREMLERRYQRMGRPMLKKSDVARMLEVDPPQTSGKLPSQPSG